MVTIFVYCIVSSISRPRGEKKPDDLTPLDCIFFLSEEYIRPICEQSGLPGLTYMAGPMVDDCTGADPPHSAGVLAAVCYPCNGSKGSKRFSNCSRCYEEYNIDEVLLQSCKLKKLHYLNCTVLKPKPI